MEPAVPDHVTAVLVDPVTTAVNCCVRPVINDVVPGLMVTDIEEGAVTVTDAEDDFVASTVLVAVTV
jgi:hypothetical protein